MLTKANEEVKQLLKEVEEHRRLSEVEIYLDKASDFYNLVQIEGNDDLKAYASCILGDACCLNNDFSYAISLLTAGVKTVIDANDDELAVRYLNEIGVIYHHQGHYISAKDSFERCIRLCKKNNFYRVQAMAYSNYASLCREMNDFDDALDFYIKAVECFHYLEDEEQRGSYLIGALSHIAVLQIWMDEELKASAMVREVEAYIEDYSLNDNRFDVLLCRLWYRNYIGDPVGEAIAKERVKDFFYNETNYFLDYEECLCFFKFLYEIEDFELLQQTMDYFRTMSVCEDMIHQFVCTGKIYIKMYEKLGDREKLLEAAYDYIKLTERQSDEVEQAFASAVKLQKKLSQVETENYISSAAKSEDMLTEIPDRANLTFTADALFEKARAEGKSFGIEIMDIDFFKDVNDAMGREVGDLILKGVADILRGIRNDDIFIARYDSDEFVIIYFDMNDTQIKERALRIKDGVDELGRRLQAGKISVSQGIMNHVPTPMNKIWDYFHVADEALYQVKSNGRGNCRLVNYKRDLQEPYTRLF